MSTKGSGPIQLRPFAHVAYHYSAKSSRSSIKSCQRERRVDDAVCKAITSMNELFSGNEVSQSQGAFRTLPATDKAFSDLRFNISNFHDRLSAHAVPSEFTAWASITKVGLNAYGCVSQSQCKNENSVVPRGEVVRSIVHHIDLPHVRESCSLSGSSLVCETLPDIFRSGHASELINVDSIESGFHLEIQTYADPNLAPGSKSLNELAGLLVLHNLCIPADPLIPEECGMRLFTVSKGSAGPRSQRLILDARRVSAVCHVPPAPPMGSVSALAAIEFGAPENWASCQWEIDSTDLSCYFYSLRNFIPGLAGLLFLEGVKPCAVKQLLVKWLELALVSKSPFSADDPRCDAKRLESALKEFDWNLGVLGFTSPAMGFSWSPWLAQTATNYLVKNALKDEKVFHIVHQMRSADASRQASNVCHEEAAVMTYLDDITALSRKKVEGQSVMDVIRKTCRSFGLHTHKDNRVVSSSCEGVNQTLVSIGVEICLEPEGKVVVRPRADKLRILIAATEYFVKGPDLVPHKSIERLLGHWAWILQIKRSFYSILYEVYHLIYGGGVAPRSKSGKPEGVGKSGKPGVVFVPDAVKKEFQHLLNLVPFLESDLCMPLSPTVYMSDAGPVYGAVVKAVLPAPHPTYSDEINVDDLTHRWKLVFSHRWVRESHNNILEAKTTLWCAQLAQKNHRTVCWSDSLVTIGAFSKGRSSSFSLNRVCRMFLAVQLDRNIVLLLRYVCSGSNYADGPSRGLKFASVAVETRLKEDARRKKGQSGEEADRGAVVDRS